MQKGARRLVQGAAWCIAMTSSLACAQVDWDVSGFASIGAGKINKNQLNFMEYTNEWSFESDSVLGVQGILTPTERLSLTAQVVARGFSYNTDDEYQPEFEWLFASYDVTSDVRVRTGRLRTPHYLFSESLEVGYSYPWVRPPVDMYVFFLDPFSHFDGADINVQSTVGDIETEVKVFVGEMAGDFLGIDMEISRVVGFTAAARLDQLTLRYGVNLNRIDLSLPNGHLLIDGFAAAAALDPTTFGGISENFYNDNDEFQYHGVGAQWEPGAWSITGEKYVLLGPSEGFSFDSRGWYLSVGRQFGHWMPYTVVGEYRTRIDSRIVYQIRDTYDVYPEGQGGIFETLDRLRSAALFALLERNIGQRSNTLGIRWDFHSNAALKLEFQYFDFLSQSTGHMLPDNLDAKPSDALVTTLIMDVVF